MGEYFENFVDGTIAEGRFKTASEVIRAGLHLLEQEENRIKTLRQAIQQGIDSGIAQNFNPNDHLKYLKANKNKNA